MQTKVSQLSDKDCRKCSKLHI